VNDVESLSHTKWECKYHVVWTNCLTINVTGGDDA